MVQNLDRGELIKLHRVVCGLESGGAVKMEELDAIELFKATHRALPLPPVETNGGIMLFRGVSALNKKGLAEEDKWEESQEPGYKGIVTLPAGVRGVYWIDKKNGNRSSNFIQVDFNKISEPEAEQVGIDCLISGRLVSRSVNNEPLKAIELPITQEQLSKHLEWIEARLM